MFKRLKALLTRSPRAQVQHPEFGLMTFYSGLWSGQIQHQGKEIFFTMAGSEVAPSPALLQQLRSFLNRSNQLEASALDFLCAQKRLFNPRDFTFERVKFLWLDKPDVFAMEFFMEGDLDGIWRVEFEQGQPKKTAKESRVGK